MDATTKVFREKITALNNIGFNLVKITNPVTKEEFLYIYDMFNPVDTAGSNHTFKHKVKGIDVTEFVEVRGALLYINMNQIDEGTLRSHLNAIKKVSREFSSHYLWETYLVG